MGGEMRNEEVVKCGRNFAMGVIVCVIGLLGLYSLLQGCYKLSIIYGFGTEIEVSYKETHYKKHEGIKMGPWKNEKVEEMVRQDIVNYISPQSGTEECAPIDYYDFVNERYGGINKAYWYSDKETLITKRGMALALIKGGIFTLPAVLFFTVLRIRDRKKKHSKNG